MKIKADVLTRRGTWFEVELPATRIVCPACKGDGTELYGGLKGAAFSPGEMEPEFAEAYFGGAYDVPCSNCRGQRVIDIVDEEKLTPKMAERYWRAVEYKRDEDAADEAERRHFERASRGLP